MCKVSHNSSGNPILFYDPPRERQPGIPQGTVAVTVEGEDYEADFRKVAVNVMRRAGASENVLPEVLRGWFGDQAGAPGTTHWVVFAREGEGYRMEPVAS